MTAEPAPVPNLDQLVPLLELAQRPCWAIPAITVSEPGTAESEVIFPHSEAIPARLLVTFTHVVPGAADGEGVGVGVGVRLGVETGEGLGAGDGDGAGDIEDNGAPLQGKAGLGSQGPFSPATIIIPTLETNISV